MEAFVRFLERIGVRVAGFLDEAGRLMLLFLHTLVWCFRPPYRPRSVVQQMAGVGVSSLPIVMITAIFTGAVLALQTTTGFKRFNAQDLVGTIVALSICRELGPVLTGLIVSGRVGSGMAAELGTMRVTEQIDALETLATDPVNYLVVPRFLAALVMLPVLTALADVVGMAGGYGVSVFVLHANPTIYFRRSMDYLAFDDIYIGIVKAAAFGMIIAIVGCYRGFNAAGGAEGVGRATTHSVVLSSMLILTANYFITAFFF
ncbi:MAG TPA: ABC transporter permease [Candidatus Methanoperedens sp.]|nr:ABC transporter permease [Candidatus Methanoperedens sp.]